MTIDKLSDSGSAGATNSKPIKRVNLLTMFRLGLFQMGLGMMSILTLGVLTRVMIQELTIPATIVTAVLAIPSFISPTRVWFGQMSDAKPLLGYQRTGYVWMGAATFAIASFIAVQAMWQLGNVVHHAGGWSWTSQTSLWTGLLALVFVLYGMAISASGTAYGALLVDVSEEDNRSKLVGIVWSMLMVGIILGSILSGSLLNQLTIKPPIEILQASVNRLFIVVPAIVFGLALLATVGIEKKYSQYQFRSKLANRENITLGKALQILTANRQTGLFFTFLLVMTIGLFMQDPIIEPYAGQVFGMALAESTKLNAFLGIGNLIALNITGFFIVPRLGKRRTVKLGCLMAAICALILGLAGLSGNPGLLRVALFLFGLAYGVTITGALSLMLDLTAAETAGTFIGAWGLAQAMARGLAVVTGGTVLDLGKSLFSVPALAYGLVFSLEAGGMVVAIWLLNRVNVTEFRTNAKQAIASVLEAELD